jgi:hypothetical protein
MARNCPTCLAVLPANQLLASSNNLQCPACGTPLEISAFSRNLSALIALISAAVVWRISTGHYAAHEGTLGWALPVLFSYLTYSVVAPIVLIFTGDLHPREAEALPPEPGPAHGAHH